MNDTGNLMADAQVDTGGSADQGSANSDNVADQTGDQGQNFSDQAGDQSKGADQTGDQNQGTSDQTSDQTSDNDQEGEPKGAPEQYERFNLPEDIPYDEALAGEFQPLAKELDLTQKQADKLANFYGELEKRKLANGQEASDAFGKELYKQAMEDPEFGGKIWEQEARACVARARDLIGGEEFKAFVEANPLVGNHPEVLRFAYRAGKVIGEGNMVDRRAGDTGKQSAAEVLYPGVEKD